MKEAMWGVGIIILGIFGLILINLFGNITTTNQQNYELMKNATEAAMYDAIDQEMYSNGFCLCANQPMSKDSTLVFNSASEYAVKPLDSKGFCDYEYTSCAIIKHEYVINKEMFQETFVRRLSNVLKQNVSYKLDVLDVVEYPPKVSVQVSSKDDFNEYTVNDDGQYNIVNVYDSLLESNKDEIVIILQSSLTVKLVEKGTNTLIPGGKIDLTGNNGFAASWNTSDANPKTFKVWGGRYDAVEANVPEGYIGGAKGSVEVSDDGGDYEIVLEDEKEPPEPPPPPSTGDCDKYYYNVHWVKYSSSSDCKSFLGIASCTPKQRSYYYTKAGYTTYYSALSACRDYATSYVNGVKSRLDSTNQNGCQAYSSWHWAFRKDDGSIQYSISRFPSASDARKNCLLAHDPNRCGQVCMW